MHAAAAYGGEPLDLAALEIEQIHDRARDPEEIAQPRQHGSCDRARLFRGQQGAIDLVQERETFGRLGE